MAPFVSYQSCFTGLCQLSLMTILDDHIAAGLTEHHSLLHIAKDD